MNKNARKWVEALRSGKYKQYQGALNYRDSYCCLGVACEVAMANGVKLTKITAPRKLTRYGEAGDIYALPPEVMKWLGIKTPHGSYPGTDLVRINDSGAPFAEIADTIEENQKALFRE